MSALEMLYSPRVAARSAAQAGAWAPLLALGAAGAFADYPMLLEHGGTWLIDLKLRTTPEGLTRPTMLIFLAFQYAAPVLLPLAAWVAGRLVYAYLWFVLDVKINRREVVRTVAYGFLPLAFERLIAGVLQFVPVADRNPFNPLASNPAFFFDSEQTRPFWYELARGLDAFSLWALIITSAGLSGLSGRRTATLLPALAALWLAGLAIKAWLLS